MHDEPQHASPGAQILPFGRHDVPPQNPPSQSRSQQSTVFEQASPSAEQIADGSHTFERQRRVSQQSLGVSQVAPITPHDVCPPPVRPSPRAPQPEKPTSSAPTVRPRAIVVRATLRRIRRCYPKSARTVRSTDGTALARGGAAAYAQRVAEPEDESEPRPPSRPLRIDTRPRNVDPRGLLTPPAAEGVERDSRGSGLFAIALGLALVLGGGLLYRKLAAPADPSEREPVASASSSAAIAPPPPPRCVDVGPSGGFVIGELPARKKDAPAVPSSDLPPLDDAPLDDDQFAPFAVVFGRAVASDKGFVLGALRDGEGGTLLSVVTLGADGVGGHAVKLARSRGDLEPPVVVPDDDAVLAAMLEPNASGLALKLARVRGDKVEWGAELDQGRDDSLAIDLAISGDRGALVWDESKDDGGRVMLASFRRSAIGTTTAPRVVSADKADADSPRLVSRKGGYYLAYLVHGAEIRRPAQAEDDLGTGKKGDKDEIDESKGEEVASSWVEVVPLDENGSPTASPLRVTPEAGRVAGYDVAPSGDGLLLAWRNEESPTGAGGGQVGVVRITASGATPTISLEDGAGDGVPVLMNGWLSIPTLRGADMLARLDADGKTSEPVEAEPSIGRGEPLAALGDHVLLGEPEGKAMRLRVVACGAKIVAPKPADSSGDAP